MYQIYARYPSRKYFKWLGKESYSDKARAIEVTDNLQKECKLKGTCYLVRENRKRCVYCAIVL